MQPLLDVFLLAAASFAVSRLWFEGSIFAAWRERASLWGDADGGWRRWLGELLTCPLCFSTQTTILLSVGLVLPQKSLPADLPAWILVTLAAAAAVPVDWLAKPGG